MRRLLIGCTALSLAFWAVGVAGAGIASSAEVASAAGGSSVRSDFDGDGFGDLAVGVPSENTARGAVNVIYGSAGGLTASDQYWTQDSPGIKGTAEDLEGFGDALAAGDFDGDGFGDLAVGVPGESSDADPESARGAVNVLYGSSHGLTAAGNQLWSQDSPGINGTSEGYDAFGSVLAAANFGKSAHADLAIGVPGENNYRGAVSVIYGSAGGLTAAGDRYWSQDSTGIKGTAEYADYFGFALAAANFGKSAHADLAIGAPEENNHRGAVNVIYGSAGGLTAAGDQYWTQDSPGIKGLAEGGDSFGSVLAAANFGKSAQADLAIGMPWENNNRGAVNVIYGSSGGLTAVGDQYWTQDSPGIKGVGSSAFGFALGVANFGKSAQADLAVGVPGAGISNRGAVNVIYGSAGGLTASGDQYWTQDSPGIKGTAEPGDSFGEVLDGHNAML